MSFLDLDPIAVLTGVGISAESGVPTFRGAGGLWEKQRAEELATPEAFSRDPELVWRFYQWRRQLLMNCSPNHAHQILASIESLSNDFTLITQNVDGLHQAAESEIVLEIHGSIWRLRCVECSQLWTEREELATLLPTCPACGGLARPDVV